MAKLVTLFTPATIALGGGVMKSQQFFLDRALGVIREVCTQVPAEKTQIILASHGSERRLVGAAQVWLWRYR